MNKSFIVLFLGILFGGFYFLTSILNFDLHNASKVMTNPLAYSAYRLKGNNMIPNFTEERYYISEKLPKDSLLNRGEVIIAGSPFDHQLHLKRVIGLPNENIQLINGKIYINKTFLEEPYLPNGSVTKPGNYLLEDQQVKIPPDSYFLLNDNRVLLDDSRTWGIVRRLGIYDRLIGCYRNCN